MFKQFDHVLIHHIPGCQLTSPLEGVVTRVRKVSADVVVSELSGRSILVKFQHMTVKP